MGMASANHKALFSEGARSFDFAWASRRALGEGLFSGVGARFLVGMRFLANVSSLDVVCVCVCTLGVPTGLTSALSTLSRTKGRPEGRQGKVVQGPLLTTPRLTTVLTASSGRKEIDALSPDPFRWAAEGHRNLAFLNSRIILCKYDL